VPVLSFGSDRTAVHKTGEGMWLSVQYIHDGFQRTAAHELGYDAKVAVFVDSAQELQSAWEKDNRMLTILSQLPVLQSQHSHYCNREIFCTLVLL
jgi:hypothetical protein